MHVDDENEVRLPRREPVELDSAETGRYWEVVQGSLKRVFQHDPTDADKVRDRVEHESLETQEKFYQTEPYSVAADIAGEVGPGTPEQQLEYLRIKREAGYGDGPEIPPQLWATAKALTRA